LSEREFRAAQKSSTLDLKRNVCPSLTPRRPVHHSCSRFSRHTYTFGRRNGDIQC
jgi:hypothetical protein